MVLEARGRRHAITESLIDDWVGHGLLDQAQRRSRGRGRGVAAGWSRHQRDLLLDLLARREQVRHSVRSMAKVPVGVWVYFGDEYVPLRQVRRALETYAGIGRPTQRLDHRPAATRLIHRIARPGARRQAVADLVEAIVESARIGRLDTEALAPLLDEVVGPPEPDAQLDGRRLLAIYVARFAARARFHELEDWHFRWARAFHWWASKDYAAEWRTLAGDPRFGLLHERPSLESSFNEVCGDLLQILGMALTGSDAALPEFLKLDAWRAGRARLTVETGTAARLGLVGPSPNGILLSARITLDGRAA
jgi:hypothetical protein